MFIPSRDRSNRSGVAEVGAVKRIGALEQLRSLERAKPGLLDRALETVKKWGERCEEAVEKLKSIASLVDIAGELIYAGAPPLVSPSSSS